MKNNLMKHNYHSFVFSLLILILPDLQAAELQPTTAGISSISLDGGNCLTGSSSVDQSPFRDAGAAYLFRKVQTGAATDTYDLKLVASEPRNDAGLGSYISLSGSSALVSSSRLVYLYRHLDTATGILTEDARLTNPLGTSIGSSLSLSGSNGLVGAYFSYGTTGTAYFFRNLDRATGLVVAAATLQPAVPQPDDEFGRKVSLSGNSGLVSASADNRTGNNQGAVYYFRDLSTASGTVTEDAKLVATGDGSGVYFGTALSLDGDSALIGAGFKNVNGKPNAGKAYYFRHLERATGVVTTNVRLTASNYQELLNDDVLFGYSVCLSGSDGLVGDGGNRGGVYLFRHLDAAAAEITEDVEMVGSSNLRSRSIGPVISLNGDVYAVRDTDNYISVIQTGSISALTTLDLGHTSKTNANISFNSRVDWIVGETTDANRINLLTGDGATVLQPDKGVYIGKNAGSDDNLLDVAGTVKCNLLQIGSPAGNVNNVLQIESTALVNVGTLRLANSNRLVIRGDIGTTRKFLATTTLQVWIGGAWMTVTDANYRSLIRVSENNGYTIVLPVAV